MCNLLPFCGVLLLWVNFILIVNFSEDGLLFHSTVSCTVLRKFQFLVTMSLIISCIKSLQEVCF